jgi:hypothetical protein
MTVALQGCHLGGFYRGPGATVVGIEKSVPAIWAFRRLRLAADALVAFAKRRVDL